MDLRPWDQWTREGQANPGTEEILATLDAVLKLNENHPLANHLYIHAAEASPHPERADAAADRLRGLQSGLAHNVHMPSHIDIRRGRWQQAIETNLKAVEADRRVPAGIRPADGAAADVRGAQRAHARLRRDDDRPARAGGGAHPGDGRGAAAGLREGERAGHRGDRGDAAGGFGAVRAVGRGAGGAGRLPGLHAVHARLSATPPAPSRSRPAATPRRRARSRRCTRRRPGSCRPNPPSATTPPPRSWRSSRRWSKGRSCCARGRRTRGWRRCGRRRPRRTR